MNYRVKYIFFIAYLSLCAAVTLFAQEQNDEESRKWVQSGYSDLEPEESNFLGMTPAEVYESVGPPAEIFSHRGEEEWMDNTVFYYPSHLYLFWFENRIWQVRMDQRYEGEAGGLRMGDAEAEVIDRLGKPYYRDDESVLYNLPDRGYPVRLRLFFTDDTLTDIYIYRGDF